MPAPVHWRGGAKEVMQARHQVVICTAGPLTGSDSANISSAASTSQKQRFTAFLLVIMSDLPSEPV
jgi:hypothetical protein